MNIFEFFGKIGIDNKSANKAIDETTSKAEGAHGKLSAVFGKIGQLATKAGKVMATGLAVGVTALVGLTGAATKRQIPRSTASRADKYHSRPCCVFVAHTSAFTPVRSSKKALRACQEARKSAAKFSSFNIVKVSPSIVSAGSCHIKTERDVISRSVAVANTTNAIDLASPSTRTVTGTDIDSSCLQSDIPALKSPATKSN